MASSDRIDELKRKFDENPRRYFAPLANEFRKGGDLDQAILICQEFLPQQPGHMSGHIVYGQALYETGRLDEARGVFETALSLDPENLIALRHLGDIAGRQGDSTSARRWYERVLEADPRNDEIQSLLSGLHDAPAVHDIPRTPDYSAPDHSAPDYSAKEPSAHEPHTAVSVEPARHSVPAPADEPELLDLEVTIPQPTAPAPVSAESGSRDDAHAPRDFDLASSGEIEPTPETADLMPKTDARAEGFESTEFNAPETPVKQAEGLESAFEVETGVHVAHFEPLPGLDRPQTTIDAVPGLATTGAFPELDEPIPEDRGDVLPPHGDPIVESAPAPATTSRDDSLLDLDMPVIDEPARAAPPELEVASGGSEDVVEAGSGAPTVPTELPPEVIAAEAALIAEEVDSELAPADATPAETADDESVGSELSFIDVGESTEPEPAASQPAAVSDDGLPEPAVAEEASAVPAAPGHRPFVTETMAELYLKQGFRHEALAVYEQLSTANPSDDRLSAKVASLRADLAAPATVAGPAVRDFFARIAARRPGERAVAAAPPSEDDFGPSEGDAPPAPPEDAASPAGEAAHEATSAPAANKAPERRGGSIDALFGHRPSGSSEDSAAAALAQAFGSGSEPTPLAGNPTRPAAGELSLDSVFREGSRTPRSSQAFSFDQFFSQNVEGDRTSGGGRPSQETPAAGEPAERSEDDIEQFNSWLQGLKQR
jgi:hypothetical protein